MRLVILLFLVFLTAYTADAQSLKPSDTERWYKGQTHMHTLWSDGDAAPELAMKQYKDFGFDFVVLTDHNVVPNVEKWFPIDHPKEKRLTTERVDQLKAEFGEDKVEVRTNEHGVKEMRLKTFDELKALFDQKDEFLLILGEEVTARVHINGLNVRERIPPVLQSEDNVYVIKKTVEAVNEQSKRFGIPMMAHINHPNFSVGVTPGEFVQAKEAKYFEIYNGHGSVDNWGNKEKHMHPVDKIWDIALAFRLIENPNDILYGLGTDDAHSYFQRKAGSSIPDRGWTMVLAGALEENALIEAIMAGRCYASSGVLLESIESDGKSMAVDVQEQEGVTFTTQFIGTRKGFDQASEPVLGADGKPYPSGARTYSDEIGVLLHETTDDPAQYTFTGDEIYVRAKVVSSKDQEFPFKDGDKEMAWTQPVVVK